MLHPIGPRKLLDTHMNGQCRLHGVPIASNPASTYLQGQEIPLNPKLSLLFPGTHRMQTLWLTDFEKQGLNCDQPIKIVHLPIMKRAFKTCKINGADNQA